MKGRNKAMTKNKAFYRSICDNKLMQACGELQATRTTERGYKAMKIGMQAVKDNLLSTYTINELKNAGRQEEEYYILLIVEQLHKMPFEVLNKAIQKAGL